MRQPRCGTDPHQCASGYPKFSGCRKVFGNLEISKLVKVFWDRFKEVGGVAVPLPKCHAHRLQLVADFFLE